MHARAQIEATTDIRVFEDLASWWNAQPGPVSSIFLRSEWFAAIAEGMDPESRLLVLVARHGSEPVAALPMVVTSRTLHPLIDWQSELFDVIHDETGRGIAELIAHLERRTRVELRLLPECSPLLGRKNWILERRSGNVVLPLPSDPEELNGRTIGPSTRRQLRRALRVLEDIGSVTVRLGLEGEAAHALLDEGLELEVRGWKGREGTAVLQQPRWLQFYRRLVPTALEQGWLRLGGLYLDDRLVAFHLNFEYGQRINAILTTYDEKLPQRASPGQVLLWKTLEDATQRGIGVYEFGSDKGGTNPAWKAQWSDTVEARSDWLSFGWVPSGIAARIRWNVRRRG